MGKRSNIIGQAPDQIIAFLDPWGHTSTPPQNSSHEALAKESGFS
ncbi:MAG: hypothetical protein AAGI90_03650 [Chlamydiota bacterium]